MPDKTEPLPMLDLPADDKNTKSNLFLNSEYHFTRNEEARTPNQETPFVNEPLVEASFPCTAIQKSRLDAKHESIIFTLIIHLPGQSGFISIDRVQYT